MTKRIDRKRLASEYCSTSDPCGYAFNGFTGKGALPVRILCLLFFVGACGTTWREIVAQSEFLHRMKWSASWISHPTAPLREPIVLHFRKQVILATVPTSFIVHASADNRFVLYVNGQRIGAGPARSDLAHWHYETFDLSPYLRPGTNVIAATVWNFGIYAPMAQISDRTAFLLEGDGKTESIVNTDSSWFVEEEEGQTILPRKADRPWNYMAVGPGETLDAARFDWQWLQPEMHSGRWLLAAPAVRESIYKDGSVASSKISYDGGPWALMPDTLPHMSYSSEDAGHVVRTDLPAASQFPQRSVSIPARSHVHILLDRSILTTGYPQLSFSGGKGARILLTYAEALVDKEGHKGDRSAVGDRQAIGFQDQVSPDGGVSRVFEPLWWRTWRYLDLDIETAGDPLSLEHLTAHFTAYPFKEVAQFSSSDRDLNRIWAIGWHGTQLAAHETYMDTPYYEELQYVGDTRVEAMTTYAVTGDDRLPREAIRALDYSRIPEGITQSRYPSHEPQYIPPFSLLWIGMLHDSWMYRPDTNFVREILPGTRPVLRWFLSYQQPNGLLKKTPWWNFVDWVPANRQFPSFDKEGQSCLLTLQLIGALRDAIEMENALGDRTLAAEYEEKLQLAVDGTYQACWDPASRMLADSPSKDAFSQQSNSLAVLYDVIPAHDQAALMQRILQSKPDVDSFGETLTPAIPNLIPASYYFRYYVARALDHAHLADRYMQLLQPWRDMLPLGFSTWPEIPGDSRSDSHAWSAHPTFDLLALVAGIQPAAPGFASVKIEPHLGSLTSLNVVYPHPAGLIRVNYALRQGELKAQIDLPEGPTATFVWKGQVIKLKAGPNRIDLNGGSTLISPSLK
jgi:alpha-L-rhamnosidase